MPTERWQDRYLRRFYFGEPGWVDGTTEFHQLCREVIAPGAKIVEIGAGPTNATSRFLAGLGAVHGLDPDPDVRDNSSLETASVLGEDGLFPFPDGSFDACVADNVVEHVAHPHPHLLEVRRVLKPGAPYLFRTPNLRHYVYAVSARTPHAVHLALANRLRALPGETHDPYPTVYAMNRPDRVREFAAGAEFDVELLRMVEKEPSYGMASRLLFVPLMMYERAVNSTERLAAFRSYMFVVLRRRG
jgi:SAM-dependent methyltransferase